MTRAHWLFVVVTVGICFLASPASAQGYSLPIEADGTYITAYFDHDSGGGRLDWNCSTLTYNGHKGTDIGIGGFPVMDAGSKLVFAAAPGEVVFVNDGCYDRCQGNCATCGAGFGNYVKIRNADGSHSIYGHLMTGSPTVVAGDTVTCGQAIGRVGSSGNSTGPHLHFEHRLDSAYSTARDSFTGSCSSQPSSWIQQNEWNALPAATCEGSGDIDGAVFVSETVPDGTDVDAGAAFTKTWTLRNTGTTTWRAADGYVFAFASGEAFAGGDLTLPGDVAPGAEVTLSIDLVAPASEGTFRGTWRMEHDGTAFGHEVWVEVDVTAPAAGVDDAAFVSETVPDGTEVDAGTSFTKTWTLRNTGTTTWRTADDVRLVFTSGADVGATEIALDAEVAPGAEHTFTAALVAPGEVGTQRSNFRMHRGGTAFGTVVWVEVDVTEPPAPEPAPAPEPEPAPGVDDASFVSETVPDGTPVLPGDGFFKEWTLENDGTTTWPADGSVRLVRQDAAGYGGADAVPVDAPVAPGETFTAAALVSAPTSLGVARSTWRMERSGAGFGDTVWVEVEVVAPGGSDDDASFLSETFPDGTALGAGEAFTKTWTVRNSGTTTWSPGDYRLERVAGAAFGGAADAPVDTAVAPGEERVVSVDLVAPDSAGTHRLDWRMAGPSGRFGDTLWVEIVVDAGGAAPVADASFVSETLPDGTQFGPGEAFTKTWTLANTGTATWTSGATALVKESVDAFGGLARVPVDVDTSVAPGASVTFAAALTAPEASGTHRSTWRLEHAGQLVGSPIWVEVEVVPPPPEAPGATLASESPADGVVFQPDTAFEKTWTFENTGTVDWTSDDVALRYNSGGQLGADAVLPIPDGVTVPPGETWTFAIDFVAPSTPEVYRSRWQLTFEGVRFGPEVWVDFRVATPPTEPVFDAALVDTAPAGTLSLAPGESATRTWTLENTGNRPWRGQVGHRLAHQSGDVLADVEHVFLAVGEAIQPGQSHAFTLEVRAPDAAGRYEATWQLDGPQGAFGDALSLVVEVAGGGEPEPSPEAEPDPAPEGAPDVPPDPEDPCDQAVDWRCNEGLGPGHDDDPTDRDGDGAPADLLACACTSSGHAPTGSALALLGALGFLLRRRRRPGGARGARLA